MICDMFWFMFMDFGKDPVSLDCDYWLCLRIMIFELWKSFVSTGFFILFCHWLLCLDYLHYLILYIFSLFVC